MATPKQTDPQFKLRLTPELKNSIETAALINNRSMNAEIVARLEASFDLHEALEKSREVANAQAALINNLVDQSRIDPGVFARAEAGLLKLAQIADIIGAREAASLAEFVQKAEAVDAQPEHVPSADEKPK